MKNKKAYLNWHYVVLTLFLMLCFMALIENSSSYLLPMIPVMIPVGLVQLITGIDYSLKDSLPEYFQSDWGTYWIMTACYFVILMLLYQSVVTNHIYELWLLGPPWLIAFYQFNLVSRIYKWESSKADEPALNTNSKF